jgi:hypothetical protein
MYRLLRKHTAANLLLDAVPGALGAYSLRKLRTAYSGYCVKVQRATDNTQQDIGFIGGIVDTASIRAFATGGNGFIAIWYDQSENTNNATQGTGFQPIFFRSDTFVTVEKNGVRKLALDFDPNPLSLVLPTGFLNGATSLSYFQVAQINDYASSNGGVFGPSTTNSVGLEILQHTIVSFRSFLRVNGTGRNSNSGAAYQLWDDATPSLTSIFGNSTDVTAYKNSSAVTLTSSAAMPALNFNGVYVMGYYNSSVTDMRGLFLELVIYDTNETANRSTAETNINTFYSIY